MRLAMVDVARRRGTKIDFDWGKRASKLITNEALEQIASKYVEEMADASRAIVRQTAKVQTGALERAIGHYSRTFGQGSGAFLTWEMTPLAERRRGRLSRAGQVYYDKNGVKKRYPRMRKEGTGFAYYDNKGHGRHVDTVADYARLLEFSRSRVLRHIKPAHDANYQRAKRLMIKDIETLLDKAGL